LKHRKGPLKGSIKRHDCQKVIVSEVGQELLQGQKDIAELGSIIHGARNIQAHYNVDGLFLGGVDSVHRGQADAGHGVNEFTNRVHFES
jgi:hypothetical protein